MFFWFLKCHCYNEGFVFLSWNRVYLYYYLPQILIKQIKGQKFSVKIDICFVKDMHKNIPPTTHSVIAKSITIFWTVSLFFICYFVHSIQKIIAPQLWDTTFLISVMKSRACFMLLYSLQFFIVIVQDT